MFGSRASPGGGGERPDSPNEGRETTNITIKDLSAECSTRVLTHGDIVIDTVEDDLEFDFREEESAGDRRHSQGR